MRLAFVLTRAHGAPDSNAVLRRWRELEGHTPALAFESADDQVQSYRLGEADLFVAAMPAPVPDREADEAAKLSVAALGTGWQLEAHGAHLLVTLRGEGSYEELVAFTRAVAVVAELADAVGVYWGAGHVTHPIPFFVDVARGDGMYVLLWNGVSLAAESPTRISLLSMGMQQLGLPDLLLGAPRATGNDALAFFSDLLEYVANRGQPLPDGDTVGRTATEKVPVRYVPSPVSPELEVCRIDLP